MKRVTPVELPLATLCILCVTGLFTGLQFVFPQVLSGLERTPTALANHEWWRLFTPLFVHSDGWKQIAFNFPAILIVGTVVERIFGHRRLFIFYFSGGLVGEIAAYAWQPYGAGASVAGAGVLGALAFWLLLKPAQAKVGAAFILLGAGILIWHKDIHGPPVLAGACIAAMLWFVKPKIPA